MSLALSGALATAAAVIALGALPRARTLSFGTVGHPDRSALRQAGWSLALWRWELVRAVLVALAAATAWLAGLPPAFGLVAAVVPSAVARLRAESARDRSREGTARLLQTAHAALRSGLALPEALRRAVGACDDAIARLPFESALRRFTLGDALDTALLDAIPLAVDERARTALTTLSVGIAERLPIDRAAALVGSLADRAAYEQQVDAEVRARASGARMQARILALTVPALALYLSVTMPGLATTLGGPLGRTILVPGAFGLEIAGIVLGRRIVRAAVR